MICKKGPAGWPKIQSIVWRSDYLGIIIYGRGKYVHSLWLEVSIISQIDIDQQHGAAGHGSMCLRFCDEMAIKDVSSYHIILLIDISFNRASRRPLVLFTHSLCVMLLWWWCFALPRDFFAAASALRRLRGANSFLLSALYIIALCSPRHLRLLVHYVSQSLLKK